MIVGTTVPRVSAGDLGAKVYDGFKLEPLLCKRLAIAERLVSDSSVETDPEAEAIGRYSLSPGTMAIASKRLICDQLSVDDRKLNRITPRLAAALVRLQEQRRRQLENTLGAALPANAKLHYVDIAAYDETPLAIRARNEEQSLVFNVPTQRIDLGFGLGQAPMGEGCLVRPSDGAPPLRIQNNAHAHKVLQLTQIGGMLVVTPVGYAIFLTHTANGLAVMECGTASSLVTCNLRLSTASRAAQGFKQQTRLACTDGGSANLPCEAAIARGRGQKSSSLHMLCDAHKTSLIHNKTFSLLGTNVRGMIACALALRVGAAMTVRRRCLMAEIESRLEIRHGDAPPEAEAFKSAMLKLFVSNGKHVAVRRTLLFLCPNGDWRCHQVQYYAPLGAGGQVDRRQVLRHLTTGVLTALCACRPEVYPRHRWTGCDLATDDLGILEACHSLLSTTFLRVVVQATGDPRRPLIATGSTAQLELGSLALEDIGDNDMLDDMLVDAEAVASCPTAGGERHGGGMGEGAEPTDFAKVNAVHKRSAAEWLRARPLGHLMLQRMLLEPLRQLLGAQFKVAGAEWEQEQACKAAAAVAAGDLSTGSRQYRLALAAQGDAEQRCREQVAEIWGSEALWSCVPLHDCTVSFRALDFKCISSLACSIHELLEVPHQAFPTRMFLLLAQPELARSFVEVPECLLDSWSCKLRSLYPSLAGDEFRHTLLLCVLLCWNDISTIEAKHASVRRILVGRSVQTHKSAFDEVSANWVFMQARNRAVDAAPWERAAQKKAAARRFARARRKIKQEQAAPWAMCLARGAVVRPPTTTALTQPWLSTDSMFEVDHHPQASSAPQPPTATNSGSEIYRALLLERVYSLTGALGRRTLLIILSLEWAPCARVPTRRSTSARSSGAPTAVCSGPWCA